MAVTHLSSIRELLLQALQKARETSQFVLVSQVQKVDQISPLSFFHKGRKLEEKHRMFWHDPFESMTYVGLGSAYKIQSDEDNRFNDIEKKWDKIRDNVLFSTSKIINGTGPILLGGFSFDPLKKKTALWSEFPEAQFILPKYMLTENSKGSWLTCNVLIRPNDNLDIFDHYNEEMEFIIKPEPELLHEQEESFISDLQEIGKHKWLASVDSVTEKIRESELEKVVLARELRIKRNNPFSICSILNNLMNEQPTSYLYAFENNGACFLGASPERLVKRNKTEILSTCLAGSIGRGTTVKEDDLLGQTLLKDEKNLHEHKLVVQAINMAIKNLCEDVKIPEKPILYKVRDIQHLYTPVIGKIKDNVSILDIVKKLHPTPALGGVPKQLALKKIRQVEELDRGWYAAPIGWIDSEGNGEFAVAIRSGLVNGKQASLFAGCGVVEDSDAMSEYEETMMKFRPMMSALGGALE